jgi:hypothetical protein
MSERLTSLGYQAIGKQTNPFTPVTPATYVPYYKNNLATDMGLQEDAPVYGNKFMNLAVLQGSRSHKGTLEFIAEPNSIAQILDSVMTKTNTASLGGGLYQHTYQLTNTDPNFYTYDISTGNQVIRFIGVGGSKFTPTWSKDIMHIQLGVSALGSFYQRTIASVTTNVLTLDTTYDPTNPTFGLVAADLVRLVSPDGTTVINTTVTSITPTTVTVAAAGAALAGYVIQLRPVTNPTLNILPNFMFPRTQYLVGAAGATAAATLSANTQTRLETGVALDIMHNFNSDSGEARSGAFDPAALARTQGTYALKYKQFFDTPAAAQTWQSVAKQAAIMRAYSGNGYEFRFTGNNLKIKGDPISFEAGKLIYHEMETAPQYDQADGMGMQVDIINTLATI